MNSVCALVFARYPVPGEVKTRMTPPLTGAQAAALHAASLRAVCELVRSAGDLALRLIVTPDEMCEPTLAMIDRACAGQCGGPSFRTPGEDAADSATEVRAQGGGDLGERLTRAAKCVFDEDARGVILLGADSPTIPIEYLREARTRLHENDVVLGPADDGGYYLLAMRGFHAELFTDIQWSTPHVLEQTRERIRDRCLTAFELPSWYDLDRFEDLKRALRDLTVRLALPPASTWHAVRQSTTFASGTDNENGPAATALHALLDQLLSEYAEWKR